jgi:predicted regulator of Ras-like GTPase activity (Roadblock/LC7/MglB family)
MSDYAALALRVSASMPGIRGCLMLSRDGLLLGAHPEGEAEAYAKSAWLRFAALGDAERSYVEFPDQTWAFVRRGGYGAFAIADADVRPGVLVDLLEQALMAGEMERIHDRETMRLPEAPFAPSGKPRTSLHKPERPPAPPPARLVAEPPEPAVDQHESEEWLSEEGSESEGEANEATTHQEPAPEPEPEPEPEPAPEDQPELEPAAADEPLEEPLDEPLEEPYQEASDPEEENEVDRILLAKEFAGLLQVPKEDDEANR